MARWTSGVWQGDPCAALCLSTIVQSVHHAAEGLQPSVVLRLADVLRAENKREGLAILLVEQNVRFALSLASRYTVLARGEVVDQGPAQGHEAMSRVEARLSL